MIIIIKYDITLNGKQTNKVRNTRNIETNRHKIQWVVRNEGNDFGSKRLVTTWSVVKISHLKTVLLSKKKKKIVDNNYGFEK